MFGLQFFKAMKHNKGAAGVARPPDYHPDP
jgi:hypothetical protein